MFEFVRDKEKRRAFLLSLLLHLLFILFVVWFVSLPQAVPVENYLVIDIGTPSLAEEQTLAAAADAPAPVANDVLVKSADNGSPEAAATPAPNQEATVTEIAEIVNEVQEASAEVLNENTEQPSAAIPTPPTPTEALAQPKEVQVPQPSAQLAIKQPAPQASAEVTTKPVQTTTAAATANAPVSVPEETTTSEETSATVLPEINETEIKPQPVAQSVPIPKPEVELKPIERLNVASEVKVNISELKTLPSPSIEASTTTSNVTPQPVVNTEVIETQNVIRPQISTSIANSNTTPQANVSTSVGQAKTVPQPNIAVTSGQSAETPVAEAITSVSGSQSIPEPTATVSTSSSSGKPTPEAIVMVAGSSSIPKPEISTSVSSTVSGANTQSTVSVASARAIPTPSDIQSTVSVSAGLANSVNPQLSVARVSNTANNGGGKDNSASGISANISPNSGDSRGQQTDNPGGNADRSGQTTDQAGADPSNLGLAAGPNGSLNPSGAPRTKVPYREERERALNVIIDNAEGYPQMGLREASMIVELPVEGGVTRLMTSYDNIDPGKVGPIRSARDYFFTLNNNMNGILVHNGGSPSALAAIAKSSIPTFDGYTNGDFFDRSSSRSAPYNLYSSANILRKEMSRLHLNRTRVISGTKFFPNPDTEAGPNINVRYSGIYKSGFKYESNLDLYRWVRNGKGAVDAGGEAVYVDAVIIANIKATPIPGDDKGRLYIPLSGGRATLYINGRKLAGHWSPKGGLEFSNQDGEIIDLSPYKIWVLYTPQNASIYEE